MRSWKKYKGGNLSLIPTQQRDVVISVHPQFAELFRLGQKDIEIRRRFPFFDEGTRVYFYETAPAKCIQMEAKIQSINYLNTQEVRDNASHGMPLAAFDRYFENCDICVAVKFKEWTNYSQPIQLPSNFQPPVSWRYAPKDGF